MLNHQIAIEDLTHTSSDLDGHHWGIMLMDILYEEPLIEEFGLYKFKEIID